MNVEHVSCLQPTNLTLQKLNSFHFVTPSGAEARASHDRRFRTKHRPGPYRCPTPPSRPGRRTAPSRPSRPRACQAGHRVQQADWRSAETTNTGLSDPSRPSHRRRPARSSRGRTPPTRLRAPRPRRETPQQPRGQESAVRGSPTPQQVLTCVHLPSPAAD